MKRFYKMLVTTILAVFAVLSVVPVHAEDSVKMWRLYNPNSGEHFYTASTTERDSVYNAGWDIEGYGWVSPSSSNTPVYRLYNPNAGDHHYTKSEAEKDNLVSLGWRYEGISWYAVDGTSNVPIYREYNPNAKAGAHNFASSKEEHNQLVSAGWKDEGIAFYALGSGSQEGTKTHTNMPISTSNPESNSSPSTWDGVFVYSVRSNKFHKSNCSTVKNINSANKRTTTSRETLISSGKLPCNICNL